MAHDPRRGQLLVAKKCVHVGDEIGSA